MTKYIVFLFILGLFIGCGNSSNGNNQIQNTTSDKVASKSIDKSEKMVVAKDKLLRDVIKDFNGYKILVKTDHDINKSAVSNNIIRIYGTINEMNTASLLKLNSNYPSGTKIVVEVLSENGDKILGKSKIKTIIDSRTINFGSINISNDK